MNKTQKILHQLLISEFEVIIETASGVTGSIENEDDREYTTDDNHLFTDPIKAVKYFTEKQFKSETIIKAGFTLYDLEPLEELEWRITPLPEDRE